MLRRGRAVESKLELPARMFDRAVCAPMRLAEVRRCGVDYAPVSTRVAERRRRRHGGDVRIIRFQ
jgi:hypothetical protein